jgi:hypothetical protein
MIHVAVQLKEMDERVMFREQLQQAQGRSC